MPKSSLVRTHMSWGLSWGHLEVVSYMGVLWTRERYLLYPEKMTTEQIDGEILLDCNKLSLPRTSTTLIFTTIWTIEKVCRLTLTEYLWIERLVSNQIWLVLDNSSNSWAILYSLLSNFIIEVTHWDHHSSRRHELNLDNRPRWTLSDPVDLQWNSLYHLRLCITQV